MSTEPIQFGNCDRCGQGVAAAVKYENEYGLILEWCRHCGNERHVALTKQGFRVSAARATIEVG